MIKYKTPDLDDIRVKNINYNNYFVSIKYFYKIHKNIFWDFLLSS